MPSPTDAQLAAGNYRKEHVRFHGLDLAIETPKGSERRGIGADGEVWSVTMPSAYGYIKRTMGADDEQLDCYLGPDAKSADVWIVNQVDAGTSTFDEHKIMLGFSSEAAAVATFTAAFSDGQGAARIGKVGRCTVDELKAELAESKEFRRNDAVTERVFETPAADATDHDVAIGIRDCRFASPQTFGDFMLFDLRITGTGMAYRDSIDEWAFRDPAIWLTDEFVTRCNGLPVIFGHPDRSGLNHQEFVDRSIGTIVLPYIKGDEVWGIAKIFDKDAAVLMQTTHRSTSPGVTPPKGSSPVLLEYGTADGVNGIDATSQASVLAEGLPLILDHLAVCQAGVWDKDAPPGGIRLDSASSKESSMTDAEIAQLTAERDAAVKERNDARATLDAKEAEEEKAKADASRRDAMELDAKRKDGESEEDYEKRLDAKLDGESDEEFEDRKKDRKAKKDAAAAAHTPVDADRGTEIADSKKVLAQLDELAAQNATFRTQIASLTAPPSIEDGNEIAKAWGRWDSLYQALGDPTPTAYHGEKPRAYLRRLADGVRKYTDSWKTYVFQDAQQPQDFDAVSNLIYGEALAHAKKPVLDKPGFLREMVTHPHGKTRTEFIGDHKAAWLPFMQPRQFAVASINRPTGNVYAQS